MIKHYDILTKFQYLKNNHKIKIKEIIVDMNSNKIPKNNKYIIPLYITHTTFTGQKPLLKIAKDSYANFKIRKGMVLGTLTTIHPSNSNFNIVYNNILFGYLPSLKRQFNQRIHYNGLHEGYSQVSFGVEDLSNIYPTLFYHGVNISIISKTLSDNWNKNIDKFYFSTLPLM